MKKFICFVVILVIVSVLCIKNIDYVFANDSDNKLKKEVNVYIFKGDGCGYCANAINFFYKSEYEYGKYFNLIEYEIWHDDNNSEFFNKVSQYFNKDFQGVPVIIVGERVFNGFGESDGEKIMEAILEEYNKENSFDIIEKLDNGKYNPEIPYVVSYFSFVDTNVKNVLLNLSSIFSKIKI